MNALPICVVPCMSVARMFDILCPAGCRLSGIWLPAPVRFSGWPAGDPVSGFRSHLRQLLGCSAGIIYGIILVTPDSRHNRCALNFGTTRKDAQRLCLGAVSKNRPLCYTLCCTFRRCVVPQNCTIKTCILLYLSSVCNTFRLRRYVLLIFRSLARQDAQWHGPW